MSFLNNLFMSLSVSEHHEVGSGGGLSDDPEILGAIDRLNYGHGNDEDQEFAFGVFDAKAKMNDFTALYWLGECYEKGYGCRRNYEMAAECYLKAAATHQNGCADYRLADLYRSGKGVEHDEDKAKAMRQEAAVLLKAAPDDDAEAQYLLGEMYKFGLGIEQDTDQAVEHFILAAKRGHVQAKFNLGRITKDPKWMEEAADAGHGHAAAHVEKAGREQIIPVFAREDAAK